MNSKSGYLENWSTLGRFPVLTLQTPVLFMLTERGVSSITKAQQKQKNSLSLVCSI